MKKTLPTFLFLIFGFFHIHANGVQDSVLVDSKIELIENYILNQKQDSAISIIQSIKASKGDTYIKLLHQIATNATITNKDFYNFFLTIGNRPNIDHRLLSKFIDENVKAPSSKKPIDLEFVYIKWLQTSKLSDYVTIEEANKVDEALEQYISDFDATKPDVIRARILASSHNIVVHVIQKNIAEGKKLALENLKIARQLKDTLLQITSLYHLSDFLIEEKKLQEYIAVSEESLQLEKQLTERSPLYIGTVIHLVNAYVFAGGHDDRVKELLNELYSDPQTRVHSFSLYAQYLTTIQPESESENEIFKLLEVNHIIEFCEKIERLSKNVLNQNDMYHVLNQSGIALQNRGYYKEANSFMEKCLRLREKTYSSDLAQSLADYQTKQAIAQKENEVAYAQVKSKLYSIIAILASCLFLIAIFVLRRNGKQRRLLNTKNEIISKSLNEKDKLLHKNQLLFKEMNHRVKNNFQIVSSLMELQTKGINDETALQLAKEGKNRINAMALIHQKLYENNDLDIEISDYISKLILSITDLYNREIQPKVIMDIPQLKFDIDTAMPLGLIINEIITNAFKYGFNKKEPRLEVSLCKTEQNIYKLTITDNGTGLPIDFDLDEGKGLGLRLIHRLSKQLHGSFEYSASAFTINFKDAKMRLKTA